MRRSPRETTQPDHDALERADLESLSELELIEVIVDAVQPA